jgi:type III pantothenate kinase
MDSVSSTLIAVDIGNSWIKLGRFERGTIVPELPQPTATLELALTSRAGDFDPGPLTIWCREQSAGDATWLASSVHRGAAERLEAALGAIGRTLNVELPLRQITFDEVPLAVEVDAPQRVGMDRLMGAVAANRLRPAGRAAIVVDLGTATKAALVTDVGAFVGGAIWPGLSMSAAALHEQTDALPLIEVAHWQSPPQVLGKSTVPAMESGIFWGAVGAVREIVEKLSFGHVPLPVVFVTGGNSRLVAQVLAEEGTLELQHLPHLVLSGVAIVDVAGKLDAARK